MTILSNCSVLAVLLTLTVKPVLVPTNLKRHDVVL